ncbi:hypothetical protein CAP48_04405 [Advenella sp. S44]|nr:hypothetical protein CAP48_04405 [Advenella sp. S44]
MLILLALLTVIFVSLGRWQLHRADERRVIAQRIESGRALPPLTIDKHIRSSDIVQWRPATVAGHWLGAFSVLLNRNQNGRPGYWLATPMLLQEGSREAVMVLRGWFPQVLTPDAMPEFPLPEGRQTVSGDIALRVPRLFELWNFGAKPVAQLPQQIPQSSGPLPQVQNLDLAEFAKVSGLHMLPLVLMQTGPSEQGLVRDWPHPSIDADTNTGYAIQWFAFAAIAALALLISLIRLRLKSTKETSSS